ncbi:hypothetical protein P8452_51926 [Trifolium repens]|nr:hypothetical protein P8452_51926 [Trifolium repens]
MDLDNDMHESPALPNLSDSQDVKLTKKNNKRKRKKTKCNAVINEAAEKGNGESGIEDKGGNFNSVVVDAELFAKESVSEVVKMNREQSITASSSIPEETSDSVKNGSLAKNQDEDLEVHEMHESPALSNLSGSQNNVDVKLTKKNNKRKRKKTKCNAVKSDVNACGTPENICSSKTSTSGLDICLGENEKRDKNIISEAAEKGNGESGIRDKGCNFNSVEADAELFAKESVSEVVKMNIEQSITASSSVPEETSDSVKNGSLVKNLDENLEVHDLSDKSRCIKTYSRKKLNNASFEGNLDGPSPVNCNKEPTIQDHHNDNSHEVSDGPLTDGLMETEMEQSTDQNKVDAEEIGLIPENNSEQKTTTTSSVVDVPVTQLEETNARQVDHAEVTRNDTCCPGDVSEQKTTTASSVVDVPVTQLEETNARLVDHTEDTRNDTGCSGDISEQKPTSTSSVVDIPVTQLEETNARQVDHAEDTRNDTGCSGDVSEQKPTSTSSVEDIPVTQLEETNARQVDHAEVTRNDRCCPGDVSDLSLVAANGGNSKMSQCSVERTIISNSKNKLLILDVNGLLADCVSDVPNGYYQPEPDFWIRRRKVYKRPYCDSFLQFCFDKFHVGVWSSRTKCNVDEVIKCLMGKSASRLLFCWNQSHCTTTKFSTVENKDKPLVLKELRKLWEKLEPGLPWEKGEFHESNTLLLDDSPYKALVNPKYTAIFPYSYRYYHTRDSALGPKGDLRAYLERLAMADNVQKFVESNPFGQRPIREANPSWGYYLKVIESVKCRENDRPSASDKEQTA